MAARSSGSPNFGGFQLDGGIVHADELSSVDIDAAEQRYVLTDQAFQSFAFDFLNETFHFDLHHKELTPYINAPTAVKRLFDFNQKYLDALRERAETAFFKSRLFRR